MKTCSNILRHRPIDTTPIAESVNRLCLYVIAMLEGGMHRAALEAARKAQRTVREFCKTEFANLQAKQKLDMLCHKHWRRLVLKELGGAKALARWVAAMQRCKLRAAEPPSKTTLKSTWRKTPERMAEELRQKAHAQKCAKATMHPRVTRDPFKMDRAGQFRLPPLPRLCGPRDGETAWTTPFDITAYRYDATPVIKISGYAAPIMVWPAEFGAAELWDYERWLRAQRVTSSTLSSRANREAVQTGDPLASTAPRRLIPHPINLLRKFHRCGMTELEICSPTPQAQKEDLGLRSVNIGISDVAA